VTLRRCNDSFLNTRSGEAAVAVTEVMISCDTQRTASKSHAEAQRSEKIQLFRSGTRKVKEIETVTHTKCRIGYRARQ